MDDEINVDLDELDSAININIPEFKLIDYKEEWLTTNCVKSVYDEMIKLQDSFKYSVENVKRYSSRLKNISGTLPPSIVRTISNPDEIRQANKIPEEK